MTLHAAIIPILAIAVVASAFAVRAHGRQSADVRTREPTLEDVRKATARFRDVTVAVAERYRRDPGNPEVSSLSSTPT